MAESVSQFEQRKKDHLHIALDPRVQAKDAGGFEQIELIPEALPELDFADVDIATRFGKQNLNSPLFISSMTAGHDQSVLINLALAELSEKYQILMGVGSQRRQLWDETSRQEWALIRKRNPKALLIGNIGVSQLITTPLVQIEKLVDSLEALAIFVHLNSLQECLQKEGTPQFRGGLKAISNLAKKLSVPVIVKEVGCGFSVSTLEKLFSAGVAAVDVSGYGGTHWGRIEGLRAAEGEKAFLAAQTFAQWGVSTVESVQNFQLAKKQAEHSKTKKMKAPALWASGGVRSSLDAAKLIAMGADMVGLAKPWLEAWSLGGASALEKLYQQWTYELKVALFCTGCASIKELQNKRVWKWQNP